MTSSAPYLSIVLVARNDNYGGEFNGRLHNCVHWLACLVEKHQFPVELLIVDYNPVPENQPLLQMQNWPQNRSSLAIRLLHVPTETHQQLINPELRKTVPLFEFNAKNMAIRRAKGEYILSTNADILFHPSTINFIAKKRLKKTEYYRTDRFDYKKIDRYDFNDPAATLKKIQQKVFRMMLKGYAYDVEKEDGFLKECLIRLKNYRRRFFDINMVKIESLAHRWEISVNYDGFLMKYNTHCSGDFMLMHRDNWFSLRGYPEDTFISTHCDSILTVMATVAGLKENTLHWPSYHQDHARRYNTDMEVRKNNKDIDDMFSRLLRETRVMEATRRPIIVNPPDWGHAGENFAETVI